MKPSDKCLGDDIRSYLDLLARSLGLKSLEELESLRNYVDEGGFVKHRRLPRRFKRSLLLRRVRGGYRLSGMGELVLNILSSSSNLELLYEGISVKGDCSKDLLLSSLLATALTLDLRRLEEVHGDMLPRILSLKSLQALGLGALIYVLAPPLSGDEAHSVVSSLAELLDIDPLALERCKSILWKAIMKSRGEEEAEIMEILGKAINLVNRSVVAKLTETLGNLVDYTCILARERGGSVECRELEEVTEKFLEVLGRYL